MPASAERPATQALYSSLDALPTPCVLIDEDRVTANLASFQHCMDAAGVALRPHAKTHKTLQLADRQLANGAAGLAVAKPSEARVFANHGVAQIDVAFPVVGASGAGLVAELARATRIAVHTDSPTGVRALSRAAVEADSTIRVLLEVDGGLGRCGLAPDAVDAAAELCRLIERLPAVTFDGVATYVGMGTAEACREGPWAAGVREGKLITAFARELRSRGFSVERVIAGSTATGPGAASTAGLTEVRAGAYAFMDGAQLTHGTASADAVALTVLATVVSASPSGRVTFDAGSKTLSAAGPAIGDAYAIALGGNVRVTRLNEEHGIAELAPFAPPVPVGTRLRLIPSYASAVVGMADELVVVRGERVVDGWPVAARGCST
ncbi:MAG: alanine racemase [Thermoleophilaceae bacterium]